MLVLMHACVWDCHQCITPLGGSTSLGALSADCTTTADCDTTSADCDTLSTDYDTTAAYGYQVGDSPGGW